MSGKITRISFLVFSFLLIFWMAGAVLFSPTAFGDQKDVYYQQFIIAGNVYLRAGSYDDALREFQKASELIPLDADVLIGLVRSYSRNGDFDQALVYLNRFREHYPFDARSNLINGEILALKGHQEESAAQFIHLIEMGVYRFEALQALIRIYAESGDENYHSIIRKTIALYEPVNQKYLYKLLYASLEKNQRHSEASRYRKIHDAISSTMLPDENLHHKNEIESAVSEAKILMSRGLYRAAEDHIAKSSKKWPSEKRFHDLLKECYMSIVSDRPMYADGQIISGKSTLGSGFELKRAAISRFDDLLPDQVFLSPDVRVYVDRVADLSIKSEDYFNSVYDGLVELQERMDSEPSYMTPGEKNEILNAHIMELRMILDECVRFIDLEIMAMEKIIPPVNFTDFHKYHIQTNRSFSNFFGTLKLYTENWEREKFSSAMTILEDASLRMENEDILFKSAVEKELGKLDV